MSDNVLAALQHLPVQGAKPTLGDDVDIRTLIPNGMKVARAIRYSDDVWAIDGYPLVNATVSALDFTPVPDRWRFIVRDWVLLRLNPELATTGASGLSVDAVMAPTASAERPLGLPSAVAYITGLAISLQVIDNNGWRTLGSDEWAGLASQMAAQLPDATPATLAGYCRPLVSLWRYRDVLGVPSMFGGLRPFAGTPVESVFDVPRKDLNVERPVPEYCGPLLGLALFMLDHCADDILARLEVLKRQPFGELAQSAQVDKVEQWLRSWEASGRALPGVVSARTKDLTVSWASIVKNAGCSTGVLRNPRAQLVPLLAELREQLGVSPDHDGFDLPIATAPGPGGKPIPWISALPPVKYGLGLQHWANALVYACAFVIVMLTTVRDRELAALPHRCLREDTFERGDQDIEITRMHGYLVKNRASPLPASWVVGQDVIRAVEVIHRLKAALEIPTHVHPVTGEEVLLPASLIQGHKTGKSDTVQLDLSYLQYLKTSGDHLAERGLTPALPAIPKMIPHRALRITAIHAYASQPWGDALAASQAKWSSRTVAEGYLGHLPNSVFISDPDAVQEVSQVVTGQALVDAAVDLADDPAAVQGAGVARLNDVLAGYGLTDLRNGPTTNRQLARLARDHPNVYIGEGTICIHGPGGLCGNPSEAEWMLCRPGACRNSAVTRGQRARHELRRRNWTSLGGVFARARAKLEEDLPGLEAEFAPFDDAFLRDLMLSELPGRFALAARGGDN